ncbi:hypothetical protein M378DRAFT_17978 [Amanita muscaria Koide BX008]|uniref:Uncharacterized protein n=1 Tax=Amanita muscaria (strain Koide BX008) TaxID=946122 RepID=A0A0C2WFP4_AMAMK|nr:hypothetical protein M378DRAFT_17978 [Amanita muscaria Koide BX008]
MPHTITVAPLQKQVVEHLRAFIYNLSDILHLTCNISTGLGRTIFPNPSGIHLCSSRIGFPLQPICNGLILLVLDSWWSPPLSTTLHIYQGSQTITVNVDPSALHHL